MDLMYVALLLVVVVAIPIVQVLWGYRCMMDKDQNPWWTTLVGRRLTALLFEYCVYRMMPVESLKEVHEEAMKEKAIEMAATLKRLYPQDGAARGGVLLLGSTELALCGAPKLTEERLAAPLGVPAVSSAYPQTLTHVLHEHLEALALRHEPAAVVYSCGTHDLLCNFPPEAVVENIKRSHASLRAKLPKVPIVLLALHETPMLRRLGRAEAAGTVNRLLREAWPEDSSEEGRTVLLESFNPTESVPPEVAYMADSHTLSPLSREKLLDALCAVLSEQLRIGSGNRLADKK